MAGSGHWSLVPALPSTVLLSAMVDISAESRLMQPCPHCHCPLCPARICSDPFSPLLHGIDVIMLLWQLQQVPSGDLQIKGFIGRGCKLSRLQVQSNIQGDLTVFHDFYVSWFDLLEFKSSIAIYLLINASVNCTCQQCQHIARGKSKSCKVFSDKLMVPA